MKNKILFLSAFLVVNNLKSQTIQNGNCDDVMIENQWIPGNYETIGWYGLEMRPDNQDFHEGIQSIKLVNTTDSVVQALLGFPTPEIPGLAGNTYNGPISNPDSIQVSLWYKYTQVGGDTAIFFASVYDTLGVGSDDDVLLYQGGFEISQSISSWTNGNISMNPVASGTPNRFELSAAASLAGISNVGSCNPGSTLWFDDVIVTNPGNSTNTGINEVSKSNLRVFPNPANEFISFSNDLVIKDIAIFSIDGKNVFSQEVNENKIQINISELNSGVYYYQITTENGIIIKDKITKR